MFLEGCRIDQLWRTNGQGPLVVGETGFGTGLNFLALWQAWRQAGQPGKFHFISVEMHPLGADELARAHNQFPELNELAQQLRSTFPEVAGRHDLSFEGGQVRLTLLIGDGADMLASLGPGCMVDCWFLDGFAPASNPDLWSDRLFREIARLSKDKARLSTFTAVGDVRRGLQHVGFEVERQKGFGRKRHMSVAVFNRDHARHAPHRLSWAGRNNAPAVPTKVTIVGAGLAGLLTARMIVRRRPDIDLTVVDRNDNWDGTVSAIPAALITPWLDHGPGGGPSLMEQAFRYACRFWAQLGAPVWHGGGAELVAQSDDEWRQFKKVSESSDGYRLTKEGLFISQTGWVDGSAALHHLADGIDVRFGVNDPAIPTEDHAVIICAGAGLPALLPDTDFPIKLIAGQIADVQLPAHGFDGPRKADHYLIPVGLDRLIIGASFRDPDVQVPNGADRDALLSSFGLRSPDAVSDWTGTRAALPDRMPLMGPVPDFSQWRTEFAPIKHGPTAIADKVGAYWPGLYVLGALGSRGFMTAPLLADNLAAMICGEVPSLARDQLAAVHPGRFLIGDLRRG